MINFREMVLEAIDTDGTLDDLAAYGYLDKIFNAISSKFPDFVAYVDSIKKPNFHKIAWDTVGTRATVVMFANNDLYQQIYPYLDFLCSIRDNPTLKDKDWGSYAFPNGSLNDAEDAFITHINGMALSDSAVFGYEPYSSTLQPKHKQIKDKLLQSGIVGKKTIENCKKKQYTVRQTIYLAGQLRRSSQPIFSFVPAKNAQVDKFLLDAGNPNRVTKFLGGSVTPQTEPGIIGGITDKLRTAKSALLNPSNVPPLLKGIEESVMTLMDAIKMYADVKESIPNFDKLSEEKQTEAIDTHLNKILDMKISDLFNDSRTQAKDIQIKLTSLVNHIPGEKDIVGKLKATSSALGSVQSALGIKM